MNWETFLRNDQDQIQVPGSGGTSFDANINILQPRTGIIWEIHQVSLQIDKGTAAGGAVISKGGVIICSTAVLSTSLSSQFATGVTAYGPPFEYLMSGESIDVTAYGVLPAAIYTVRWSYRLGVTY